jgi:glycyl-tRNA synthetase beta chain
MLFEHESETALFAAFKNVEKKVSQSIVQDRFDRALLDSASLRAPIDHFFDGVLVMTEDMNLRRNRLALLNQIAALFGRIADFSKIST